MWGFIALFILNCSADSPDAYAEYLPDSITLNDQDTILEIIIEKLMGFDDLIPENNTDNDTGYSGKKVFEINCFTIPLAVLTAQNFYLYKKHNFFWKINGHVKPVFEIHSPPPEIKFI